MEQKNPEEEKAVIAVVNKLSELMIAKNLRGMEEILDQNFTLTHITGYQQSKVEWYKEVESESMKYYSVKEVSKTVKINGDKAQVCLQ